MCHGVVQPRHRGGVSQGLRMSGGVGVADPGLSDITRPGSPCRSKAGLQKRVQAGAVSSPQQHPLQLRPRTQVVMLMVSQSAMSRHSPSSTSDDPSCFPSSPPLSWVIPSLSFPNCKMGISMTSLGSRLAVPLTIYAAFPK